MIKITRSMKIKIFIAIIVPLIIVLNMNFIINIIVDFFKSINENNYNDKITLFLVITFILFIGIYLYRWCLIELEILFKLKTTKPPETMKNRGEINKVDSLDNTENKITKKFKYGEVKESGFLVGWEKQYTFMQKKLKVRPSYNPKINLLEERIEPLLKIMKIKIAEYIYVITEFAHCIIQAPTRYGKSTNIVIPGLDTISQVKDYDKKHSFLVGDPKGEIANKMTDMLVKRGYEVIYLNVKDDDKKYSHSFNFLLTIYDKYLIEFNKIKDKLNMEEILSAKNPVVEYNDQLNLLKTAYANNDEYFDFSLDGVYSELANVCSIFFDSKSPQQGANEYFLTSSNNLIQSQIFYFLEKSILLDDPLKFNISNIMTFLTKSNLVDNEEEDSKFTSIVDQLGKDHFCTKKYPRGATSDQMGQFIETVKTKLLLFTTGLGKVTSYNTIDIKEIVKGKKPYAIFVITPDNKPAFNIMTTLLVRALYNELINEADRNGGKLNRFFEFWLDEFASLPTIQDLEISLSICLGRGIRWVMIVQAISQLKYKYKGIEDIIQANSGLNLFIGGTKDSDIELFQKELGKEFQQVPYVNKSKGFGAVHIDWREEELPILTKTQLKKIPFATAYLAIAKNNPIRCKYKPAYTYMQKYIELTPKEYFEKYNLNMDHFYIQEEHLLYKTFDREVLDDKNSKRIRC